MQKILTSLMILLTTSCVSIKPIIIKHLSFKYDRCRIYCYDANKMKAIADEKCGDTFVAGDYNIEACDNTLGIDLALFAKYLRGKIKENISYCKDIAD